MEKQQVALFISMLSTPIRHSRLISGKKVFCLSADPPLVISVVSGIFKIKSIASGKTARFLISGDIFYASRELCSHFYIEEIKQGEIYHVQLSTLLDYSQKKKLLTQIICFLLEENPLDISMHSLNRTNAEREVISLYKRYVDFHDDFKCNVSINSFIENTSFLSRGTISKKLRIAHFKMMPDSE